MERAIAIVLLTLCLAGCAAPDPVGGTASTSLGEGLAVDATACTVSVSGWVAINEGWLEQVACVTGTRDHESLVATQVQPSAVHAAMLLAGLQPGTPGRWIRTKDGLERVAPTGDAVDVLVQVADQPAVDVRTWISAHDGRDVPEAPFRFGGSTFVDRQGRQRYEADLSGSLIGLVTFGDETIGWADVWSDQQAVESPPWQAASDVMPEPGTPVTVIIRRRVQPAGR